MGDGSTRHASRVLLFERSQGRTLLFLDEFPDLPGRATWITPGGGLEPGEGPAQAAARELLEETGLAVPDLGPVVAEYEFKVRRPSARHSRAHWHFFVHVVDEAFEVSRAHWTAEEHETVKDVRWWSLDELVARAPRFAPRNLPALIAKHGPQDPVRLMRLVEAQPQLDAPRLDRDDAIALGQIAADIITSLKANLAVDVTLDGESVFSARFGSTGPQNDPWLAGKAAAVQLTDEPSIMARLRAEAAGETFVDGPRGGFADVRGHGGSVPIRVAGRIVGTLTTSGEPDLVDHTVAAAAVRRWLASRGLV